MFRTYFTRKSIISRHTTITWTSRLLLLQAPLKLKSWESACGLQNDEDIARFNDFFSAWNCRNCNVTLRVRGSF